MATAAAAVMAAARRQVERQFFDKDAFSADRAIAIDTPKAIQRRFLDRLDGRKHCPPNGAGALLA